MNWLKGQVFAQALAYRKGGSLPFDEHGQLKL
jgi:hypothetical protein